MFIQTFYIYSLYTGSKSLKSQRWKWFAFWMQTRREPWKSNISCETGSSICDRFGDLVHVCCGMLFLGRSEETSLYPRERGLATDKITDRTKVHFGEPMGFIGVNSGAEVTVWQLLLLQVCPSTGDKRWKPGAHCPVCGRLYRWEGAPYWCLN